MTYDPKRLWLQDYLSDPDCVQVTEFIVGSTSECAEPLVTVDTGYRPSNNPEWEDKPWYDSWRQRRYLCRRLEIAKRNRTKTKESRPKYTYPPIGSTEHSKHLTKVDKWEDEKEYRYEVVQWAEEWLDTFDEDQRSIHIRPCKRAAVIPKEFGPSKGSILEEAEKLAEEEEPTDWRSKSSGWVELREMVSSSSEKGKSQSSVDGSYASEGQEKGTRWSG